MKHSLFLAWVYIYVTYWLVDLRHFKTLRAVGEGAFCKVRIVQKRDTRELYALKYIPKEKFVSFRLVENILRERKILEYLCPHPFLVNLRYAFQDDINIYMVVDLMLGGDLRYFLNNAYHHDLQSGRMHSKTFKKKLKKKFLQHRGIPLTLSSTFIPNDNISRPNTLVKLTRFKVPEIILRHFMANCCIAIHYIHIKGIVHRDIKPENILIDSFGYLHLSDFNVSVDTPEKGYRLKSRMGTVSYMAPELLRKTGYREVVDWWSLGVVMYECMFGRRPFEGNNKSELTKAILKGQYPIIKQKYSNDCIDFLKGLLKMNPRRRLGFDDGNHFSSEEVSKKNSYQCTCFQETETEGSASNGRESSFKKIIQHNFFKDIAWKSMIKKTLPSPYRPNPSKFHFDLIHEVNVIFEEKQKLKYRKPKEISSFSDCNDMEDNRVKIRTMLEKEYNAYNWESLENFEL